MSRSTESSFGPLQAEFPFVAELPEQSTTIADYAIPDHVLREMALLADRKGAKASAAIEGLLFRECGTTLEAGARRAITARFLADRAGRQEAFLEGLGLHRDAESPARCVPGTWSISQEWAATGLVFKIVGIRNHTGDVVSVRLDSKAFHRAASVIQAVIRAIGQGDYTKPPASEWRRIWHGRKGEPGVMAELLVGLKRRDEQLVAVDNTEAPT
jgi:hypothetical protein